MYHCHKKLKQKNYRKFVLKNAPFFAQNITRNVGKMNSLGFATF